MRKIVLFTLVGAFAVVLMLSSCREPRAYRIPDNILKSIPTGELAEEVLNSPYLNDMLVYDSLQYGFEKVRSKYNGLAELLDREDAGRELSTIYRDMDTTSVSKLRTDVEKGFYRWRIQHAETILAQESLLQRLSPTQLHDLLEECAAKYEREQNLSAVYGKAESTVRLMGRILQQTGDARFTQKIFEDPILQSFLDSGSLLSIAVRNEILSQTSRYLAGT